MRMAVWAAVPVLFLVGCGGGDDHAPSETPDIVETPTTVHQAESGCDVVGQKRECKQIISQQDGIVSCYVGEQACEGTRTWGPCIKPKNANAAGNNGNGKP
ncbi:MAG: hypothetical protein U0235_12400 [Polyangiaceae bacterium]